jgi:septal ring-binding cell division protein DamX
MARDYLQTAPGNYTVQFELVCQPGSITKALEQGGKSVWFVSLSYRGESCYRVFWGHYDTQAAASAAVSTIPKALRGAAPVVVRVPRS